MRRVNKTFVIFAILAIGFLCSLSLTINSFAAGNYFKIQNAELTELSGEAEGNIWSFDDSTITSDVTFHALGDTAKYTITFRNTDSEEHTITKIVDDNQSSHITFSYDDHANETVAAGGDIDFVITAKYTNAISNPSERLEISNVKFIIQIASEEDEEVILVPNTGKETKIADNSSLDNSIIMIIFAISLSIVALIFAKNRKKAAKAVLVLIAAVSIVTIATTAKAITESDNTLTFSTRFTISDRFVVTWTDGDGNEHEEIISYNSPANIANARKKGYNFTGWVDEDNNPYDMTAIVTKDLKIFPTFTPVNYTIEIDTDGDGDADITIPVNFEQTATLPENTSEKPGHKPNGWTDGNGNHYDNGADVSGLVTDEGGSITLMPDYEPNHFTVNLDTNGDGTADQTLEVTYGEEVNLPENHAEKPGHHPNGWTDGNGSHYNDGADISGALAEDGAIVSLSPDFAPNVFTIGLDYDGDGEDDTTLAVTYGQEALLPAIPAADMGSRENGWIDSEGNTYAEGEDVSSLLLENGESLSIRPNYLPIEYAIAIDTDNDGVADIIETVSYGESFTLPTNTATQPGYLPNGWLNDRTHYNDGESVQDLTITDGATVEIRPDFVPRTMNICYTTTSDPTTIGEDKCETATFDRAYYMSENYYTRAGYDAASSWSLSDGGEKAYDADEEYYPNDDILACGDNLDCTKTLYAMWNPHQTVITYTPGEGVTDATGTVANSTFTYDQRAVFSSESYTRPGYWHDGWVVNDDYYALGGVIGEWKEDVSTKTIPAKWAPKYYGVMFLRNCPANVYGTGEMEIINKVTYNDGSTLTPNTLSCGEGYSFAGWKRDNTGDLIADGGAADKFDVDLNGKTVQLYAQWHVDDHFIAGMRQAGNTKMTANDGKDYYKMQDMTSSICDFVPTATTNDNNEEIQLVDTRDGKTYWVSKLKDGKCWMTQNLDYDLNTAKTLTPSNSDVTANWTPTRNTLPANQTSSWIANGTVDSSIDLGEYYYQEGSGKPVEYNYTASGPNANFTAVPSAANGTHTHLGNLYNSNAFFAMNSALPAGSGTIETSICPRGWGLPGDYETLLKSYDIISSGGDTINEKGVMAKPLYFTRTGAVATDTNTSAAYYLEPGISLSYAKNRYITTGFGAGGIKQVYVFKVLDPASISGGNINNTVKHTYITGVGTGVSVRCIVK